MNNIYKITWNKTRAQYMTTHEHARGQHKGRLSAVVLAGLLSGTLLSGPVHANGLTASSIQADAGWKHTTITQTGNRFDITTDRIIDNGTNKVGVNKFERFELKSEHIANLHHASGSNTLVNFVNTHAKIDGTVNALADNKVGGELFFVTPQGMTIGTTGVINTGSLFVVAPTEDWASDMLSVTTEAYLAGMRRGEVPLNRNAQITVKGSINAGNAVTLAAADIHIADSARITTSVTDFKNLVNISNANGELITSAEVTDGTLVGRVDDSGDIILSAISDTETDTDGEQNDTIAKITVDGTIESRRDVKVAARAGNGEFDWKSLSYEPDGDNHLASVAADVTVNGTINAARDLSITATAENKLDDSGSFETAKDLTLELLGTTTMINFDVAYGDLEASSNVTISESAVLNAHGDLTLQSVADTEIVIGASTSFLSFFNAFMKNADDPSSVLLSIPAASVIVGLTDSTAEVDVRGTLATKGDLTIASDSILTAELAASTDTMGSSQFLAALSVGIFNASATTDVQAKSITISDDPNNLSNVTIRANQKNKVDTEAFVGVANGSYGGISVNYTELQTSADVNFVGSITNQAQTVAIESSNLTTKYDVEAKVGVSLSTIGIVRDLIVSVGQTAYNFIAGLAGSVGSSLDTSFEASKFSLGGSAGIIIGAQTAETYVDASSGDGIRSVGDVKIASKAEIEDYHFNTNNRIETSKEDNSTGDSKGSASLALLVVTSGVNDDNKPGLSSTLEIADGSTIEVSDGSLTIQSEAIVQWNRLQKMKDAWYQTLDNINGLWNSTSDEEKSKYQTYYDEYEAAKEAASTAFDQISNNSENFSETMETLGTAMGDYMTALGNWFEAVFGTTVDTASEVFSLVQVGMAFAQPQSYMNAYVGAGGKGSEGQWSVAGSLAYLNQWTTNELTIGKNVVFKAYGNDTPEQNEGDQNKPAVLRGRLNIIGRSENESVTMAGHLNEVGGFKMPSIFSSNGVGATIVINDMGTDNVVRLREGGNYDSTNLIDIQAQDAMSVVSIGASCDISKGALDIQGLFAITLVDAANLLSVDDEIRMTTADLVLSATRSDNLQTIVGSLNVALDKEGAVSAGVGGAFAFGSLDNDVMLHDNDVIETSESSIALSPGVWSADSISMAAKADVQNNTIAAAGTISLAGESTNQDDGTGVFAQLGKWIKGKVNGITSKINGLINSLSDLEKKIVDGGSTVGSKLHDKIFKTQTENADDNIIAQEQQTNPVDNDLSQVGENNATLVNDATTQAAQTRQGSAFTLALAGSVAITQLDIASDVTIDVSSMTMDAAKTSIAAVNDKWLGTWAGTAAVNATTGTLVTTGLNLGVSGALALNMGSSNARVNINANDGSLVFKNSDGALEKRKDVSILAVNDGRIVTEGLVVGVAAGGMANVGIDANVSANLYSTETLVDVHDVLMSEDEDAQNQYEQIAWLGETQVTGGTGFGLTTKAGTAGLSLSVGLIVAVAELDNTVSSGLGESQITANEIDVAALSSLVQVTTAANVQIGAGSGSVGFSGTAGATLLTNTIDASMSNSSITLDGVDSRLNLLARDATDAEDETFDKVSDITFEFDNSVYTVTDDDGNTTTHDNTQNSDLYADVDLATSTDKEEKQNVEDFLTASNMLQTTVVVSVAASSNSSVGAAVLVNEVDNSFATDTNNVTVKATERATGQAFTQQAESGVVSVNVVAGVAGTKNNFSAGGSVIVSDIEQQAAASATDLTIRGVTSDIAAVNDALDVNVAGNVNVAASKGLALGAAVIVANNDNRATVSARNVTVDDVDRIGLTAGNRAESWAASVDAGVSSGLVIGGSVLVHRVKNDAQVSVDGITFNDVSQAAIGAIDESEIWSLTGDVAFSLGSMGAAGTSSYVASRGETSTDVKGLTVTDEDDADRADVSVTAKSVEEIYSMSLGVGISTRAAGIAGLYSGNDIDRRVSATVDQVTAAKKASNALESLEVEAQQSADIANLVVVVGGSKVGVGAGVAVNRIDNVVDAQLNDSRGDDAVEFSLDRLTVRAKSDNDLDTIAVGGGIASSVGIDGSVAVNLIGSQTSASMTGTRARVLAGSIEAVSDDAIGTYGGSLAASATAAVGATVTVTEKTGDTTATLTNVDLIEESDADASVHWIAGVADDDINHKVVGEVEMNDTLADDREEKTTSGIAIAATSSETFNTFLINAAASGSVAIDATTNVMYTGGTTGVTMTESTLDAAEALTVLSGNYANLDTVMATGAASGTVDVPVGVNVVTTERATQSLFDDSAITGTANIDLKSEAKEGVSNLLLTGGGSSHANVSPMVGVIRMLSSVNSDVTGTRVSGRSFNQDADYAGRSMGLTLTGGGSAYASLGASVFVNYFGNDVEASVADSQITTTENIAVGSERRNDADYVSVEGSGAWYGSAGGLVLVNTIEGTTSTQVSDTVMTAGGDVDITARNVDKVDFDMVEANIAAYGTGGANVIVNNVYGDAAVRLHNNEVDASNVSIAADQDRFIRTVGVAGAGALGALQANVIVTNIGNDDDAFANDVTQLDDTEALVQEYLANYAGENDSGHFMDNVTTVLGDALSDADRERLLQAAAKSASLNKETGGTLVNLTGTTIKADDRIEVVAREDHASGAGVDVDVGSGALGGLVLAASVGTMRYRHGAVVDVTSSSLSSKDVTVGAHLYGTSLLETYQAQGALIGGQAAYSSIKILGGAQVVVNSSDLTGTGETVVEAIDESSVTGYTLGVEAGGVTGGAMIVDVQDESQISVSASDMLDRGWRGNTTIRAKRIGLRDADAMAAFGGVVQGVGAVAEITDNAQINVSLDNVYVSSVSLSDEDDLEGDDTTFRIDANNAMQLKTHAWGVGGSAVEVGVAQATIHTAATTNVTVSDSTVVAKTIDWVASSGRDGSENDAEALRLTAEVEAYTGSGVGINVNEAEIVNKTKTTLDIKGNTISKRQDRDQVLNVKASGYAVYDVDSHIAGGAVGISSANTQADVQHGADVAVTFEQAEQSIDVGSFNVIAHNKELVLAQVSSYGGGLVVIEASGENINAADIYHTDTSDTTIELKGAIHAKQELAASAMSHHIVQVEVDNTKGAVGGGSGAAVQNSMHGTSKVVVADDAELTAGGDIALAARTDLELTGIKDEDGNAESIVVKSNVYGAFTGTGIHINNAIDRANVVDIGAGAKLNAEDKLVLTARTQTELDWRVRAQTAGLINGVSANGDHDIVTTNKIHVGADAELTNNNSDNTIVLSASSDETLIAEVIGDVQGGVIAGASAYVDFDYTRNNHILLDEGSRIIGAGDVSLSSGLDFGGKNSTLDIQVLAHAYLHAPIGGTNVEFNDRFTTNDQVVVAGDVLSTRSLSVYADQGDVSATEEARKYTIYCPDEAEDIRMTSTALGTQSRSMTENSSVDVSGSLKAGTKTKFDLTISGIVNPTDENGGETDVHLEGEQTEPTLTRGEGHNVEGNYSIESMDVANEYWERHCYLVEKMKEYPESDEGGIYTALKAEDDYIVQKMIDEGYVVESADENGNKTYTLAGGTVQHLVYTLSDITVSGGDIAITSAQVTGQGTISAQSAEGIFIKNESSMALCLNNVQILANGGHVTMNDVEVDAKSDLNGFEGALNSVHTGQAPVLNVDSNWTGGSIAYTVDGYEGETGSYKPDSSVILMGTIANHAGNLSVTSKGDIYSLGEVSAAGSINLTATTGSVVQTYSSGIMNIGGDVINQWKTETDKFEREDYVGSTISAAQPSGSDQSTLSSIVAGGDLVIIGDIININGMIQSGYANYEVTLNEADDAIRGAVEEVTNRWERNGKPTEINLYSDDYLICGGQSRYDADLGRYVYDVSVWYDPVNQRVVLEDIDPKGGKVYITGQIANTGGGQILAADGRASVNINVDYDVMLGAVSTGNASGKITISDTMFADADQGISYKTTEFTRGSDGKIVRKSWNVLTSNERSETIVEQADSYNPFGDLTYTWANGVGKTTIESTETVKKFYMWGLIKKFYDETTVSSTTEVNLEELDSAETLRKGNTLGATSAFQGKEILVGSTSSSGKETWTDDTSWLKGRGKQHELTTTTTTEQIQYLYEVKADNPIAITMVSGNNSITIQSKGNVYLRDNIEAVDGTIAVTSDKSILNESSSNYILGASRVTLVAGGQIGKENNAIRFSSGGELALQVQAADAVYLDASKLVNTLTGSIDASADVDVTAGGNINLSGIRGTNISVESAGALTIADIEQMDVADDAQRFDAKAGGNIMLTTTGDLAIGSVETTGDVVLTVGGSVTDALPRDVEDQMSADKKIEHWIEIGILDEDGKALSAEDRYNKDIQALEDQIKTSWTRYESYQSADYSSLTETQQKDYDRLKERFDGYESAQTYINAQYGQEGSALNQIQSHQGDYHAWQKLELLYAVAESISTPGTNAINANITAKNITVTANNLVGEVEADVTHDLTATLIDENGSFTEAGKSLYQSLSRASAEDVQWNGQDRTVTISLKRPITVSHLQTTASLSDGGSVQVEGNGVYMQSLEGEYLNLGSVDAGSGVLRLTGDEGIFGSQTIKGKTVTLHGGSGNLGTVENALIIDSQDWVELTTTGGIYVTEAAGDLVLYSLTSQTEAVLTTSQSGADILSYQSDGYVQGEIETAKLVLNTDGSVGADTYALQLKEIAELELTGNSIEGLFLNISDMNVVSETSISGSNETLQVGTINVKSVGGVKFVGTVSADGSVDVMARNSVSADKLVAATAQTVRVESSEGSVDLQSAQLTAENSVTLIAGGSVDLDNASVTVTETTGTVDLTAGGDASVVGATIEAGGDVSVSGEDVNASGMALRATNATVAAKSDITLDDSNLVVTALNATAENGNTSAVGATIEATGEVSILGDDVNASDMALRAANAMVTGQSGITLDGSNLEVASLDAKAESGDASVVGAMIEATGDVSVSGDAVKASELTMSAANATMSAKSDITLDDSSLVVTALDATAENGNASIVGATIEASGDVSISGDDVNASGMVLRAANAMVAGQSGITLDDSSLVVTALDATAENGNASIVGATIEATGDVSISGDDVNASAMALRAANAMVTGQSGITLDGSNFVVTALNAKAENGNASAVGATIEASGDVLVSGDTVKASELTMSAANATMSAKSDITLDDSSLVVTALDATAENGNASVVGAMIEAAGDVSVSGDTVMATKLTMSAADATMSAKSDVALDGSSLVVASLDVTSENGDAFIIGATIEATGDVSVSGDAVKASELTMTAANATMSAKSDITLDASSLALASLVATAENGDIFVVGAALDANGDISLDGQTVIGQSAHVKAKNLSMTASEGSVDFGNGTLTVSDSTTIAAWGDVVANGATLGLMDGALSIVSKDGRIDLSASQNSDIQAESIEIAGAKGVVIESMTLTATGGSIELSSSGSSIEAADSTLNATSDVRLVAGDSIELTRANADGTLGASAITADNNVALIAHNDVKARGLVVQAASFDAQAQFGLVDLKGASIRVSDSLNVSASQSVDLSDALIPNGSQSGTDLSGDLVVTSETGDVDLSNTEVGRLSVGGSIDIEAGQDVKLTNETLVWQAQDDLTLKSANVELGDASELTATQGQLTIDAADMLNIGAGVAVQGAGVDLEAETFSIGQDASFAATNGDLAIVASGDAKLGGTLNVSAKSKTPGETAQITIGADGTLTVSDAGLTIDAADGSVNVYGGEGMTLHNDLTIHSQNDSTIRTQSGDLSIGNRATIVAGESDQAIQSGNYGKVEIEAGENLSIGGLARILADRLSLSAKDHVTFGSDATLYGVTDGVSIASKQGDITMGANLTVYSNKEETILKALNGRIHIADASTFKSENSSIRFFAKDIQFDKDFTAIGKGFVLNASGDIHVADNARVTTKFDTRGRATPDYGAVEGWLNTRINATGNVSFGDNASFETTMLLLTAGLAGDGHIAVGSGDVTFGKNASIKTSELGIAVLANGNIVFDDGATFNTKNAATRGNINVMANGSIVIGRDVKFVGDVRTHALADDTNVRIQAKENLEFKGRTELLSNRAHFKASEGDIVFGNHSTLVAWQDPEAKSTANGIDQMTFEAGRDIDMTNSVTLFSTSNLSVFAGRNVDVGSDSRICSDTSVDISALGGDITISATARIGSLAESDRLTGRVSLSAAGDVVQTLASENNGIVTENLDVTAGGAVVLGTVDLTPYELFNRTLKTSKGGNIVKNVTIDAGRDVVLSLSGPVDSTLTINLDRAGTVNGRLIVHGQGKRIAIDNDLDVRGDVSLHAAKVALANLTGDGLVEISTNFYDVDSSDGITARSITGRRVVMLTQEGQYDIDRVTSTGDLISVARSSRDVQGAVKLGSVDSADTIAVYNGLGSIESDSMRSVGTLFVMTGDASAKPELSRLVSEAGTAQLVDNAGSLTARLQTDYLDRRDASLIEPGFVPIVETSFEAYRLFEKGIEELNERSKVFATEGLRYDSTMATVVGRSAYHIHDRWSEHLTDLQQWVFTPVNSFWVERMELDDRVFVTRGGCDWDVETPRRAEGSKADREEI